MYLFVSFIIFYCTVYFLSFVGNVIVLCRCYWTKQRRPSSIRWFIANLAFSDLTFTMLSLFDYISHVWTWLGGNVSCKLQGFLIEACYTTSILTLVVISFERRKAVVTPFSARATATNNKKRKIIAIWTASLVIGSPLLYAYQVDMHPSGLLLCTNTSFGDLGKQVYYSIHGVCTFIVPFTYMIYAQSTIFLTLRSRALTTRNSFTTAPNNYHRKVAKTLAAYSFAFAVCWAPFMINRTLAYFHLADGAGEYTWIGCQLLIFLNTVLDPILYGIYGENKKASFRHFFTCTRFHMSTRTADIS